MTTRTSPIRSLGAGLAATAATLALGHLAVGALPGPGAHPTADDVVLVGLTGIGAVAAARLALAALLLLAHALLPHRPRLAGAARRLAPAVLRRMVTVSVAAGLGLGGGVAAATESDLGWVVTGPAAPAQEEVVGIAGGGTAVPVGGVPLAPEPAAAAPPGPASAVPGPTLPEPSAPDSAAAPGTVVVAPGDTLWALTAERLGPDDARVAAAWPAVHEANRAVIGPDPDLIHPGQVLDLTVLDGRS